MGVLDEELRKSDPEVAKKLCDVVALMAALRDRVARVAELERALLRSRERHETDEGSASPER